MTYNKKPRRSLTKKGREAMLERAGHLCVYCKKLILPGQPWQDCHILARELGGSDDLSNRGPGHVECHKDDTRAVAKLVAHGNRIIRKNGPKEARRKTKPIPQPVNFKWASRPFNTKKER